MIFIIIIPGANYPSYAMTSRYLIGDVVDVKQITFTPLILNLSWVDLTAQLSFQTPPNDITNVHPPGPQASMPATLIQRFPRV